MPRLAPTVFWLSMAACLILGTLEALFTLIAGTAFDRVAEHWARRP